MGGDTTTTTTTTTSHDPPLTSRHHRHHRHRHHFRCVQIVATGEKYGMWMHVDGAWGGPAIMSREYPELCMKTTSALIPNRRLRRRHTTPRAGKTTKHKLIIIITPWTVFFEADAGAHGYHMLIGAVAPCPCMLGTLRPLSRLLYVCFTSPGKGIEKADSVTLDGHKVSE